MTTVSATKARSNLYQLMKAVHISHAPLTITGKAGNCVMISEEDWHAIEETLFLTSIPGMKESILKAAAEPLSKYTDKLPWQTGE